MIHGQIIQPIGKQAAVSPLPFMLIVDQTMKYLGGLIWVELMHD